MVRRTLGEEAYQRWVSGEPSDRAASGDILASSEVDIPAGTENISAPANSAATCIHLWVRDKHGKEERIETWRPTLISTVSAIFGQRLGLPGTSLFAEGRFLQPTDTVGGLGLQNGDIIEAASPSKTSDATDDAPHARPRHHQAPRTGTSSSQVPRVRGSVAVQLTTPTSTHEPRLPTPPPPPSRKVAVTRSPRRVFHSRRQRVQGRDSQRLPSPSPRRPQPLRLRSRSRERAPLELDLLHSAQEEASVVQASRETDLVIAVPAEHRDEGPAAPSVADASHGLVSVLRARPRSQSLQPLRRAGGRNRAAESSDPAQPPAKKYLMTTASILALVEVRNVMEIDIALRFSACFEHLMIASIILQQLLSTIARPWKRYTWLMLRHFVNVRSEAGREDTYVYTYGIPVSTTRLLNTRYACVDVVAQFFYYIYTSGSNERATEAKPDCNPITADFDDHFGFQTEFVRLAGSYSSSTSSPYIYIYELR